MNKAVLATDPSYKTGMVLVKRKQSVVVSLIQETFIFPIKYYIPWSAQYSHILHSAIFCQFYNQSYKKVQEVGARYSCNRFMKRRRPRQALH